MEPADKRGGWLKDVCKTVMGVYGIATITGSTGAIWRVRFSGLRLESEEYVRGQRVRGRIMAGGVGVWCDAGEGGKDDSGDEFGVVF